MISEYHLKKGAKKVKWRNIVLSSLFLVAATRGDSFISVNLAAWGRRRDGD